MKRLITGILIATGAFAAILIYGLGGAQPADFMTICEIQLFHGQERCACMDEYLNKYLSADQNVALRALLSEPKDSTRTADTEDKEFLEDAFNKAGLFCESHKEARVRIQREKAERQEAIDARVASFLPAFACAVAMEYSRGLLLGAWSDASEYIPAQSPLTLAGCSASITNFKGTVTIHITRLPPNIQIDLDTVSTNSKLKTMRLQ